jgi:hypothetical protein
MKARASVLCVKRKPMSVAKMGDAYIPYNVRSILILTVV